MQSETIDAIWGNGGDAAFPQEVPSSFLEGHFLPLLVRQRMQRKMESQMQEALAFG